jgi:hypothetical protein
MFVSGFSIIKNAIKFDYPIVEAIKSILPVCDEFIIAVGKSEDETLNLIKSIDPSKVKIIETIWDDSLRKGGLVLSVETNKALDQISDKSDWAFYIQGDEVIHEKDLPAIKATMLKYKDEKIVEGLLFDHINFYGSYDFTANSRKWSKKEIRIIRNNKSIRSYMDAMSFRHANGDKIKVKKVDAMIYHYGWVKPPSFQLEKRKNFEKLWHNDTWVNQTFDNLEEFDYSKIDSLENFSGTHPLVMQERIQRSNWHFSFDPTKNIKLSFRLRLLNFIYKTTGWNIGEFKSYKKI